jgi:hypothetical protein
MLEGYHPPVPLSGVLDPLEICSLPSETRVQQLGGFYGTLVS